jgi:5-bromo-4-chloroindolyl phosphate hydrolysis protein
MSKEFKTVNDDYTKKIEASVKLIEEYKVLAIDFLKESDEGMRKKISNKRARALTLNLEKLSKKIKKNLTDICKDGKGYRSSSVKHQKEM